MITEREFIKCVPNLIFGIRAQSDGVLIQTTNDYYKIMLQLLRRIPPEAMILYGVISKEMKQLLEDDYDQLVISSTLDLNQQRQLTLMNVSGEDFFKTSINLTPQIKKIVSYLMRTFLLSHCKIIAIKRTADTQELGKYILVLDDQYSATTMEKLNIPFDSLQKINQLPTIK